MTKQEKKQLKELIEKLEDIQADISVAISQEQDRLDEIGDGISQLDRAMKLEENIDNLESAEDSLNDAIIALGNIVS